MRVTAWATPLPLEKAPYQPAPDAVLRLLFGTTPNVHVTEGRAVIPPLPVGSTVYWLPLDARVGLAYCEGEVFTVTLGSNGHAAQGYRLAAAPHLSVTPRGLVTNFELGAVAMTVRTKVARAAVQLLGLSRLAHSNDATNYPESRWHAPATTWTTALMSAHVRSTDLVLAFLPLALSLRTSSALVGETDVPAYLLVTPERIALVGATLAGELYLPALPLVGETNTGLNGETVEPATFRCLDKDVFQLNEHRFKGNKLLAEVARCFEKTGDERILLAAQTLCKSAGSVNDKRLALTWLNRLSTTAVSGSSRVPEWCLAHQLHHVTSGEAPWNSDTHVPNLVALWESYGFDHTVGDWLLEQLRTASPPWRAVAVELSEQLWRERRQKASDNFDVARLDLGHAKFAFNSGFPERARSVLLDTPQLFPPLCLGDLNLPAFSGASPWREVRREVEALMRDVTAADPRQQDLARQRLIALDPLNVESLREATHSAALGAKAQLAVRLLEGPLLRNEAQNSNTAVPRSHVRPLEEERIASQLSHPLTRTKQSLTSKLADAVAVVHAPDEAALKLYCERVLKADSPLLDALDRAATVLGLGHFELYVSRGKDDVGAQAFAAQTKLVLIGGQHTEPQSRHYLEPAELVFTFATELAHIRFDHSRVSGSDVVRGLLSKGKQGAELAFNLLPLISGLNLGKRLGVVTAKLSLPQINKALTAARTLESAVSTALPADRTHTDLSRPTEALLDAHRLEQLSADRAGLVCCGDLFSAFVAMLKTRTDYVRVTTTLEANGALTALEQHAPSAPAAFDDLKLRLGNLVAFYLSDDYEELRRLTYR